MVVSCYFLGFLSAAMAILRSRTPQGATAWVMSLISFPFVTVPLFLIFGRSKFHGYNSKRKIREAKVLKQFESLKSIEASYMPVSDEMELIKGTISSNNQPGFTCHNKIRLLINGEETYKAMMEDLEKAQSYIIFQVYIFRADPTGMKFADLLIRKARSGVRVSFLNDEIGANIPTKLIKQFEEAGVQTGSFNDYGSKGRGRMQINFRNHRKIIVIDGKVSYLGGHNIGDEYLGLTKTWGPWRDTHVRLEGPSVIAAQLASAKDWFCCTETSLNADWKVHLPKGNADVMAFHTGPVDDKHSCLLAHVALINSAKERLWIANPYFVPPESLLNALFLASLRGVDVRIIIPSYSDSRSVMLAMEVYKEPLLDHGVKVYVYEAGFLHQKTMVIDDTFGCVGSANFDCRSMFINFEISVFCTDKEFIHSMEGMFEADFKDSRQLSKADFKHVSVLRRITTRGANLLAPVL